MATAAMAEDAQTEAITQNLCTANNLLELSMEVTDTNSCVNVFRGLS